MRISVTASLFLALGLIHPVAVSFSAPPEDLEGSGYDLDGSGSGSGDWSEQAGEMKKDHSNSKDVRTLAANAGGGNKNAIHGSSVQTFDNKHWPANDDEAGYIVLANSKSFLENKDILAGGIAGGVAGVVLAASVTAILIYKWHKKIEGYSLGRQRDYHIPNREEVV